MKRQWHSINIFTKEQALDCFKLFKETQPKIGAFDTETTGLHIIADKPFLFQFGWLDPNGVDGHTFLVDLQKQHDLSRSVLQNWNVFAQSLEKYIAHNTTFDMHMLQNIEYPYTYENLYDFMHYIRYAHDQLSERQGGPPLGLKPYASRYIAQEARLHETLIRKDQAAQAKMYNTKLKNKLAPFKPPAESKCKSYTIGYLGELFKDCIAKPIDVLPQDAYEAWLDWYRNLPLWLQKKEPRWIQSEDIQYDKVNRELIYSYAHKDIVYVLEGYELCAPVVKARGNEWTVDLEHKLIVPLFEMERVGFGVDKMYLAECQTKVRDYIIQQREALANVTGRYFSISQHQVTLEVLNEMGAELTSTQDNVLNRKHSDLVRTNELPALQEALQLIRELRTLEKWYSTYILRFRRELNKHDMLFTTINSVGTVSGRVTSSFQQFPKEAILDKNGNELFHPRKIVTVPDGYKGMCYLDYSQIELRFQALYTILVGRPDVNLCRAYMPFRCVNARGELFDHENIEHIKDWQGEWYLYEDLQTRWTPTDVHGATATLAFDLHLGDEGWKHARSQAKTVNFAKNYGAQYGKIKEMFPEYSEEKCRQIDEAYYRAFPGVKAYHDYCYERAQEFAYTANLFGVRYYNISGHKLINMLVQGSAAFYLKLKIRELYDYSKEHDIKSPWQMQIHDELSWAHHPDEDMSIFFKFKEIMEDWPDTIVPIVAEMEYTTTNWAEKKEVSHGS